MNIFHCFCDVLVAQCPMLATVPLKNLGSLQKVTFPFRARVRVGAARINFAERETEESKGSNEERLVCRFKLCSLLTWGGDIGLSRKGRSASMRERASSPVSSPQAAVLVPRPSLFLISQSEVQISPWHARVFPMCSDLCSSFHLH